MSAERFTRQERPLQREHLALSDVPYERSVDGWNHEVSLHESGGHLAVLIAMGKLHHASEVCVGMRGPVAGYVRIAGLSPDEFSITAAGSMTGILQEPVGTGGDIQQISQIALLHQRKNPYHAIENSKAAARDYVSGLNKDVLLKFSEIIAYMGYATGSEIQAAWLRANQEYELEMTGQSDQLRAMFDTHHYEGAKQDYDHRHAYKASTFDQSTVDDGFIIVTGPDNSLVDIQVVDSNVVCPSCEQMGFHLASCELDEHQKQILDNVWHGQSPILADESKPEPDPQESTSLADAYRPEQGSQNHRGLQPVDKNTRRGIPRHSILYPLPDVQRSPDLDSQEV